MSPGRLSNLTIVVVEDHRDARALMSAFLRREGAHVAAAANGFEGLEAVKTQRPDLVLTDLLMPGRDGFRLLSDIRALGPAAGGSVPVIAMTAFVQHTDRERTLDAGFQMHLAKPFGPEQLLEAVLSVLNC